MDPLRIRELFPWDEKTYIEYSGLSAIHCEILQLGRTAPSLEYHLNLSAEEINAPDILGMTPLIWASRNAEYHAAKTLLEYRADPNIGSRIFGYPLHAALQIETVSQRRSVVDILLKYGADIRKRGLRGRSCLHIAAKCLTSFPEEIEMLLKAGAEVNMTDRMQRSPLNIMLSSDCQKNYLDGNFARTVQLLVNYGADVNYCPAGGSAPLLEAFFDNDIRAIDIVLIFLNHPDIDVQITDSYGQTVLHWVAGYSSVSMPNEAYLDFLEAVKTTLEILKKKGAHMIDVYAVNDDGYTAMEFIWGKDSSRYTGSARDIAFEKLIQVIEPGYVFQKKITELPVRVN